MMVAIGLVRGYASVTNFASLQYASEHLIACIGSLPIAAFFVYVVANFGDEPSSSRGILFISSLCFAGTSLVIRRVFWFSSLKSRQESQFLVIVDSELGALFYSDYHNSNQYQKAHYAGVQDMQIGRSIAEIDSPIIEFGPSQLIHLLERKSISKFTAVIIAARYSNLSQPIAEKMLAIHFDGIPVYSMEKFYEVYWNRIPLELVGPSWAIDSNIDLVRYSFTSLLKRFLDLVIALLLLLCLLPILALVSLGVLLFDGRPIIYSQQRMGIHQTPFTLYKFRTMEQGSDQGNAYTQERDSRVSSFGAFLRKSRLDELPQLWNVICGNMSLIGPRAEWLKLVREYERLIPNYHLRHLVRPGITGWAQVKYPYGSSLEDTLQKLSYDLYYIRNFSFQLDAAVLLKTIYVVAFGKGR